MRKRAGPGKSSQKDAEDIVAAVEDSSWSPEFRDCAARLRSGSMKAGYEDRLFLGARRELHLSRAVDFGPQLDQKGEVCSVGMAAGVGEFMEADGWKNIGDGTWRIELQEALYLPRIPSGKLTRRKVIDLDSGATIHDILGGPATKPSQITKRLRDARNIAVEATLESEPIATADWGSEAMAPEDATRYRAITARLNFLALDRPDLQYPLKECSRVMSAPKNCHWEMLKRIARYLLHTPRLVHVYRWQDMPTFIAAFSDSDWAGCRETRKSTSGGCFMHGSHLLKAYSKTQQTIALSSGEAEFYLMVKAASEAMGLQAMAKDFGKAMAPWLYVDASAALGVAQRVGLGKVRHLET